MDERICLQISGLQDFARHNILTKWSVQNLFLVPIFFVPTYDIPLWHQTSPTRLSTSLTNPNAVNGKKSCITWDKFFYPVNHGTNYQPLVSRISEPSTVSFNLRVGYSFFFSKDTLPWSPRPATESWSETWWLNWGNMMAVTIRTVSLGHMYFWL